MARQTMMTGSFKFKALLLATICSSMLPCASTFATGLLPSCDAARVGHLVACRGLTRGQRFATLPLRPMHFAHGQQVRRCGAPRRSKQSSTTMMLGAGARVYEALHAIGLSLPVAWFKMLGSPIAGVLPQSLFMASNIAYFAAAAHIIRYRSSRNAPLAAALCAVGVISTSFHGTQCALGASNPVVHAFCLFDTSTAVLSAIMFALSCGYFRTSLPPAHMLLGWLVALAMLSHTGPLYTLLHSVWHIISAALAYQMVREADGVPAPSLSLTLPRLPSLSPILASLEARRSAVGVMAREGVSRLGVAGLTMSELVPSRRVRASIKDRLR